MNIYSLSDIFFAGALYILENANIDTNTPIYTDDVEPTFKNYDKHIRIKCTMENLEDISTMCNEHIAYETLETLLSS